MTRRDQLAIGLVAAGLLCVAGAAWLLVGATGEPLPRPLTARWRRHSRRRLQASPSLVVTADLVIDVQGAVRRPGVVLLPPGARVADALSAAGGYSRQADLERRGVQA